MEGSASRIGITVSVVLQLEHVHNGCLHASNHSQLQEKSSHDLMQSPAFE